MQASFQFLMAEYHVPCESQDLLKQQLPFAKSTKSLYLEGSAYALDDHLRMSSETKWQILSFSVGLCHFNSL